MARELQLTEAAEPRSVNSAKGGPGRSYCPGRLFGQETIQQVFAAARALTHKFATALTVLLGPLPGSGVVLGSRAITSWLPAMNTREMVMVPLKCGATRVPTGSPAQAAAVAPLKQ